MQQSSANINNLLTNWSPLLPLVVSNTAFSGELQNKRTQHWPTCKLLNTQWRHVICGFNLPAISTHAMQGVCNRFYLCICNRGFVQNLGQRFQSCVCIIRNVYVCVSWQITFLKFLCSTSVSLWKGHFFAACFMVACGLWWQYSTSSVTRKGLYNLWRTSQHSCMCRMLPSTWDRQRSAI
jgi:hypothetical protein